MFGNNFYFLFSKTCFWEYKEKTISCIFEIKNMFSKLKLKKQFFEEKIEKTKICCYQDLNYNAKGSFGYNLFLLKLKTENTVTK